MKEWFDAFKQWLGDLFAKLTELSLSAKFWAFLGAVIVLGEQYSKGAITAWQFLAALIAAVGSYQISKAYEDAHRPG